jgi:hypothetical protein
LGYVLITRLGFGLSAKVCFSHPRVYLPEQGKLLCKISPTESLGCLFLRFAGAGFRSGIDLDLPDQKA